MCSNKKKYVRFPDPIFLDLIDLQIEIIPVPFSNISNKEQGEKSETIRQRVISARQIQEEHFKDSKLIHCNAQMTERMIHKYAEPDKQGIQMLKVAIQRLSLSARAYNRILKVSRTIADLVGSDKVLVEPSDIATSTAATGQRADIIKVWLLYYEATNSF